MQALANFYNKVPDWLYTSAFVVVPLLAWGLTRLIARRPVRLWPFLVAAVVLYLAIALVDVELHFHE